MGRVSLPAGRGAGFVATGPVTGGPVRVGRLGAGLAAALMGVAACSSGADQTAVPPPSQDVTAGASQDTSPVTTTAGSRASSPVPSATTAVRTEASGTRVGQTAPSAATSAASTLPPAPTSVPAASSTLPSAPTSALAASSTLPSSPTSAVPAVRPTIDELLASGEVLNIAHAGGDQEWPHSTFYAYDQAVAAGADVLEMDVQLSGDGILIVQHDDTVDKTTNATGRVDSYTFDEIAALDAGYWFAEGCWPCRDLPDDDYLYRGVRTGEAPPPDGAAPDDFRIVRFAEVVARYPDHAFDIEIKGSAAAGTATADALAAEIDAHGIADSVVVVSFDDATLEHFRAIAPDVHVSPGVTAMTEWLLGGQPLDPAYRIVQVPPKFGDVAVITPDFWDAVASSGVVVWMWPDDAVTQENAAFYQDMIDQGVTGIIAGRPSDVPD